MKQLLCILALIFTSSEAWAKAKINNVSFEKGAAGPKGSMNRVIVSYSGELKDIPALTIKESMIQLEIPDGEVWPKLTKQVGKKLDTTILAYQYDQNLCRIRALLPFNLEGKENLVNVTVKDDRIILEYPDSDKGTGVVNKEDKKEKYDEGYLNQLLKEKEQAMKDQVKAVVPKHKEAVKDLQMALKSDFFDDKNAPEKVVKKVDTKEFDKVTNSLSAQVKIPETKPAAAVPEKAAESNNAFIRYATKFIVFLGLILLMFYGIVQLMKKGIFKKGKLAFLTNSELVQVLNTTYLGPKRSLMIVKVQNQVLLLGSTEQSINLITEIKETATLLKTGEELIAGNNFDTTYEDVGVIPANIREKDNIMEPAAGQKHLPRMSSVVAAENVKFSEQIKKKLKNLRPLH